MGKAKDKKRREKNASTLQDLTREAYEFKVFPEGTLRLDEVDLEETVKDKKAYETELLELQEKLYELQVRYFLEKRRSIFVFEGWDAAGKGGAIRRLTALMDPRGYKVWPIAAPRDGEERHHYLRRFFTRIPDSGELCVFDRSWYGRVLVERVEGFASPKEWNRAYDEINAFERMLTDDGTVMRKFYLHIDRDVQLVRFKERERDPIKNFKIGPDDWRNRKRWSDYVHAVEDMFDRTHRPDAPWQLIAANDKRLARLTVLRACVDALEE